MTEILIHGAGTEGQAAARYLMKQEGIRIALLDDLGGTVDGVRSVTADEAWRMIEGSIYLRSPGIPPSHEVVRHAAATASLATTPTGYWLARLAPPGTVTVTGTKGKSTTTSITAALLSRAGFSSAAYGNIGIPPLSLPLPGEEHPVVEVSSYMCHDLPEAEHLHVVTCLYRDHIDWHGDEAAYRAAKLRPFRHGRPARGLAPRSLIETEGLPSCVTAIEALVENRPGHFAVGGLKVDLGPRDRGFEAGPLRFAMAAGAATLAALAGAHKAAEAAEAIAATFKGLPSRQEIVPSSDGRTWVDDSLATIPEASLAALDRFSGRQVVVLLGGGDRGQDFSALDRWLAETPGVRAIGFGPTAGRIRNLSFRTGSFEEAISAAEEQCPAGGVILFSPAAPSSPPHASFKERSALFRARAASAR